MSEQEKAMQRLGFTDEEIADVMDADKRIDKGEKLFEQTAEEKNASKELRRAPRKVVDAYGKASTKERKSDNDKQALIKGIEMAIFDKVENLTIINPEREMEFLYNGRRFKLTLSAPRK